MKKLEASAYHQLALKRGFECLKPGVLSTDRTATWKCNLNHVWMSTYNNVHSGTGCPYCAGNARTDLVGQRFGRLLVIGKHELSCNSGSRWTCLCTCGSTVIVARANLGKSTVSCGCFKVEQNRTLFRKEAGYSGQTYLFHAYRKGAKDRGLSFALTRDDFLAITQQRCLYCGQDPGRVVYNHLGTEKDQESIRHSSYVCNGVDRIDNSRGYEPGNVAPCCWRCNRAKYDMDAPEFAEWVQRAAAWLTQHPVS